MPLTERLFNARLQHGDFFDQQKAGTLQIQDAGFLRPHSVFRGQRARYSVRSKVPDLPPSLCSRNTSSMRMLRSIALHMS